VEAISSPCKCVRYDEATSGTVVITLTKYMQNMINAQQ